MYKNCSDKHIQWASKCGKGHRVITGTRSTKINAQQMQLAEASRDAEITATITGSTIQSTLARRNTPQLNNRAKFVRTRRQNPNSRVPTRTRTDLPAIHGRAFSKAQTSLHC